MFVAVCCFLLYNCCLSLVHDGSWRLACSKSCRRLAHTCAVCSPHLMKIKVVLLPDAPGGTVRNNHRKPPVWVGVGGLGERRNSTRGELRTARRRSAAGKLNWCRVRKYRRVSAVCFPNSYHAHRAKRGMGCAGMNRMGEPLASSVKIPKRV